MKTDAISTRLIACIYSGMIGSLLSDPEGVVLPHAAMMIPRDGVRNCLRSVHPQWASTRGGQSRSRGLEFLADLAVERVGTAAAQRDGEEHDAPDERRLHPHVALRHHVNEGDTRHFDREAGGEEAAQSAEDDACCADRLKEYGAIGKEVARNKSGLGQECSDSGGTIVELGPYVRIKACADGNPDYRVPEIGDRRVKPG